MNTTTSDTSDPTVAKKSIKARVLFDGQHGNGNDVVHVTPAELKAGEASGELDGSKAAVAYAESLRA